MVVSNPRFGIMVVFILLLSAPLQYFSEITQNCLTNAGNTTQITWSKSSLSGEVMVYSSSSLNAVDVTVDMFSDQTGDTVTARVTVPSFGTPYNVCIAATNSHCMERTDPLSCTTVTINAGTCTFSAHYY